MSAADDLALRIARSMPGWNEDTSEPSIEDPRLRAAAEAHWEKVNQTCLTVGREYAEIVGSWLSEKTPSTEALAAIIDPGAWVSGEPRKDVFPEQEAQERYEEFYWEGVRNRRQPSIEAAERLLAAGAVLVGGE